MHEIHFFSDEVDFKLENEADKKDWLQEVARSEGRKVGELNVIFTSDNKLLEINRKFLNHDYFTDIITFPEEGSDLGGEIYISIDRVKENSRNLDIAFVDELDRVLAHGLLHLIGYKDKSPLEQDVMRGKEDFCLTLRHS